MLIVIDVVFQHADSLRCVADDDVRPPKLLPGLASL